MLLGRMSWPGKPRPALHGGPHPRGEDWLEENSRLLQEAEGVEKPPPVESADFGLALEGLPENLKGRFEDQSGTKYTGAAWAAGSVLYLSHLLLFRYPGLRAPGTGERFRCWDSASSAITPSPPAAMIPALPARRVWNRSCTSYNFIRRYEEFGCGLWPCRSCPVGIDMVSVIRALGGETVAR